MQQLPLIGGSYSARSVIANAQRCLNLFPEGNRKDSPTQTTHYQRPGLVPLVAPTSGRARGLYQASNGDGYLIVGTTLYFVSSSWTLYSLGTIDGTNMCSMVDNGLQLMIANGLPYAGNATGYVEFTVNPTAGDTITLNGLVFTFVAGATTATNVHIGGSLAFTIATLQQVVEASVNALVTGAAYARQSVGGNVRFHVTYKLPGAVGTAYTLAASAGTPSNATLQLGIGNAIPGGGWTIDLGDLVGSTFTAITDPVWTGADRLDFIDTFIVWNMPGTRNFGSTLSNDIIPLDATYVAGKTGWADPLQSIIVCQEQIFLPGSLKSEIWYNSGSALFPFARQSGTSQEHGTVARQSLCSADLNIYMVSKDLQGNGIVLRLRGNELKRISNFALEYQLSLMSDITDAVGYTFLAAGHLFYVLSFPTGNQTWVWDESVGDPELGWSQRGWTDLNGTFNRDRGVLGAQLYGTNVCIDWENGTLYKQDPTIYTDTVLGREYPLLFLRTFPHLMSGTDPKSGQPQLANGQMVKHDRFAIDAECGNAEGLGAPKFILRYSDDRGRTWSGQIELHAGKQGEYGTRPDVSTLGTAMDRVYELSWSFPGKVALNGAWVEGTVLNR